MNASGRPNTCKSRGNRVAILLTTGARVSNAYVIFLLLGHNSEKSGLIPNKILGRHLSDLKAPAVKDEHAYH